MPLKSSRSLGPKPFLKWPGGKRQLLPTLRQYLPPMRTYYEPFVGAGALLFSLQPQRAVVNDVNPELINCYRVIRDHSEALIAELSRHRNERDYFYRLRALDRSEAFRQLNEIERAARIIFLNKTCYNGLFRVNRHGQFNAPFGNYANPNIINADGLRLISQFLRRPGLRILNTDFEEVLENAGPGDFIYLDPPYDPVSTTASFTGYQHQRFAQNEQLRLRQVVDRLTEKGCRVMISNSATDFMCELYKDFQIIPVAARRSINVVGSKRGQIRELLILNYPVHVTKQVCFG